MSAREKKEQIVAEIKEKLSNYSSAIFIDYKGLTVAEATELRNEFRKNEVDYKVYKNTLTEIAAKELGFDDLSPYLKGPTAIAFGIKDPTAPAKVLTESMKKLKKMEFKAGIVEGNIIDVEGIKALASLPSREELIAKMLGSMNAPIAGLVNVLSGTIRSLAYALNAIKEAKEAEA
ncbi:MAG: 50S ribosomal protein L10 [Caldicoprobacterales bacterium]|jgi:large subunit ribosomal protein L10|nr:50S ribosomal protein L10 [Clostridiales bacterium]